MGWTASLDMGSEKMVMALASGEGSVCHLKGIKIMASQGIEHGVIKDKEKVRMCIRSLMSELMNYDTFCQSSGYSEWLVWVL